MFALCTYLLIILPMSHDIFSWKYFQFTLAIEQVVIINYDLTDYVFTQL